MKGFQRCTDGASNRRPPANDQGDIRQGHPDRSSPRSRRRRRSDRRDNWPSRSSSVCARIERGPCRCPLRTWGYIGTTSNRAGNGSQLFERVLNGRFSVRACRRRRGAALQVREFLAEQRRLLCCRRRPGENPQACRFLRKSRARPGRTRCRRTRRCRIGSQDGAEAGSTTPSV